MTVTFAVAVCPEQIALAPHAAELGVMVSVLKIGAALTVTVAEAVCPTESVAVKGDGSVRQHVGRQKDDRPRGHGCATGRIAELLDMTKYGATPPEIVSVAGVFE